MREAFSGSRACLPLDKIECRRANAIGRDGQQCTALRGKRPHKVRLQSMSIGVCEIDGHPFAGQVCRQVAPFGDLCHSTKKSGPFFKLARSRGSKVHRIATREVAARLGGWRSLGQSCSSTIAQSVSQSVNELVADDSDQPVWPALNIQHFPLHRREPVIPPAPSVPFANEETGLTRLDEAA